MEDQVSNLQSSPPPPPSSGGGGVNTTNLSLPKRKSGIFGASSNLVNSIVGAGIIGIPYALRQSGLLVGLGLLFLVAFLTDKSLRVIVELATWHPQLQNHNILTFEDLAFFPFGTPGKLFILANMLILAYGAMVAYLLIIKDTLPTLLGLEEQRELIMMASSICIIVPLSMQRDMASLAFTSLLSVSADVILVGFILGYAPVTETVSAEGGIGGVLRNDAVNPTLFIGLGILSTAMACQHCCFNVSNSLERKTRSRWAHVTGYSIGTAAFLCTVLGVCGYLGFLDETQGNVLNNFDSDSVAANAARGLLAITMIFTYPMESFVARHVLVMILHGGDLDGNAGANENGDGSATAPQGGFLCLNRRHFLTLSIYIITLIPALIVDDLGPVLSITGSLGGSCISYIAPGMLYLGVNGDAFLSIVGEWLTNYQLGKKSANGSGGGDVELPVVGDSTQVLPEQNTTSNGENDFPIAGERRTLELANTSKPFWYYLGLFPLWCYIASWGSSGMRSRMDHHQQQQPNFQEFHSPTTSPPDQQQQQLNGEDGSTTSEENEVILPKKTDFYMAIFFIVFGAIGAVAGVGSNIYAQLHH